ncbi:MAG TPA: thioredoxin [Micropepsaceae bacterium]|nr:thioredoxin [Micropepsaceae bacterium]
MATLIDPAGRPIKAKQEPGPRETAAQTAPGAQPPRGAIGAQTPQPAPAAAKAALIKDADIQSFAADVLDASMEVPVIVDFWAPWCGPCKQLGPNLERAVTEAKGAVRLVKVNIDENPEIAQQLRIQSIPTVYAFFQGQPVDGFMGAIPESQVKVFVQTLITAGAGAAGTEQAAAADEALKAAAEALSHRDLSQAAQIFGQVLQADPGNPKAVAGLARCYLESGDIERAKKTLQLVRPDGKNDETLRAIEAELSLKERAGESSDLAHLRAKLAANASDHEARFELAKALDAKGAREEAIGELLEIIRRDRKWNEDAARKHLITLFDAMGPTDPRTIAARRRLSAILFS